MLRQLVAQQGHFIVQQGDNMRELREATFEKPLNELVDGQVFE